MDTTTDKSLLYHFRVYITCLASTGLYSTSVLLGNRPNPALALNQEYISRIGDDTSVLDNESTPIWNRFCSIHLTDARFWSRSPCTPLLFCLLNGTKFSVKLSNTFSAFRKNCRNYSKLAIQEQKYVFEPLFLKNTIMGTWYMWTQVLEKYWKKMIVYLKVSIYNMSCGLALRFIE